MYPRGRSASPIRNNPLFLTEPLKVEDLRTHACTIFFENLLKICTFERETEEEKNNFIMILAQFDNIL